MQDLELDSFYAPLIVMEMNKIGIYPPKEITEADNCKVLLDWLKNEWDSLEKSVENHLIFRASKDGCEYG